MKRSQRIFICLVLALSLLVAPSSAQLLGGILSSVGNLLGGLLTITSDVSLSVSGSVDSLVYAKLPALVLYSQ
jgi:hypothetical protein